MDGRDIVRVWSNGQYHYMVRDVFNAWVHANRPPINDSWRDYDSQEYLRNGYEQGWEGFAPADDPNYPNLYPLGHMRAAALDIDYDYETAQLLEEAGLIRPFPWESWHWAPRDIYWYPPVNSLPSDIHDGDYSDYVEPAVPIIILEEDEFMRFLYTEDEHGHLWVLVNSATGETVPTREQNIANSWAVAWGNAKACDLQSFLNALHAVQLTTDPDEKKATELKAIVTDIRSQLDRLAVKESPKA